MTELSLNRPDDTSCRWIVSQEGSRESYGVPLAFQRLGCLRLLCTDVWCRAGRTALRRGPAGARALATRFHAGIPLQKVTSFNSQAVLWRAWQHFRRNARSPGDRAEQFIRYGRWFAGRVRDHLARLPLDRELDCFFGFNTNCLETLEFLKEKKLFTIVDQIDPGRVEEEMVLAEAERWPGWEKIPGRLPEAYWRRLQAEWKLADLVLVNSEWSREALVKQGVASERIVVVPLAIDLHDGVVGQAVNPHGRLKVIWLGSVILRKGIQYLVEAARRLSGEDVEFIVAGPIGISQDALDTFPPNMKVVGRITRDQLGRVYKQGHVFVLPTISDGFAITQLEAMRHGLVVVATPNCGRVVTDGLDGLIVPTRDGMALAAALSRLNADRQLLLGMSRAALETVKRYDLQANGRLINLEAKRFLNTAPPGPESAAQLPSRIESSAVRS